MIYSEVKGQKITTHQDTVVADSVNFLAMKFDFCKEWNGYSKTAVFYVPEKNISVYIVLDELTDNCVGAETYLVPFEVITEPGFNVSVFGVKDDSRITTNESFVEVIKSGLKSAQLPQNPTLSEYEQILLMSTSAKEIAQSVRNDADSGIFIGPKGDKGDKGEKGEPFTYSDFNDEQLAALKGEKGDTGATGPKGAKGDKGDKGDKGNTGSTGPQGPKGDKGDKGEPGEDYIFTEADKTEIANIVLQNFTDVAVIGQ